MLLDLPFNPLNDDQCHPAQYPQEVMVKSESDDGECYSVIYLCDFLLIIYRLCLKTTNLRVFILLSKLF